MTLRKVTKNRSSFPTQDAAINSLSSRAQLFQGRPPSGQNSLTVDRSLVVAQRLVILEVTPGHLAVKR